MKKAVALTSAMLGSVTSGLAHVSEHTETQPETGFHATPLEIGILTLLTVIVVGLIYKGLKPEVEEDEE